MVNLSNPVYDATKCQEVASDSDPWAREFLQKQEAERDARRRELGVSDDLAKVDGVTTAMMIAFGENGIKTVEDLADCATDELLGWVGRDAAITAERLTRQLRAASPSRPPAGAAGPVTGAA